jgi:hypothetical protein
MLKHFFDISTGFRYKKNEKSSLSIYRDVHALAWIGLNFYDYHDFQKYKGGYRIMDILNSNLHNYTFWLAKPNKIPNVFIFSVNTWGTTAPRRKKRHIGPE